MENCLILAFNFQFAVIHTQSAAQRGLSKVESAKQFGLQFLFFLLLDSLYVQSYRSRAVLGLNDSVECVALCERLTTKNALELVSSHDIVIDCSDNVTTRQVRIGHLPLHIYVHSIPAYMFPIYIYRYILNDASVLANKPLVSGAAIALDSQVRINNK